MRETTAVRFESLLSIVHGLRHQFFFRLLNFSSFTIVKLAAGCRPSAEMPTSGDLKSGDFFSDQPFPPPLPPTEFADATFPRETYFFYLDPLTPPPPHEQFRGKNVDLSVKDLNWLNTHPIRLSYIGVTRKKLSYFCLQRTTRITQEIEARNHNTSRKSEIRKRDDFGILEHMELES